MTQGGSRIWMRWPIRLLGLAWLLFCLYSFVLEIESPLYFEAIDWTYWGPVTEIGWRESSLLRWALWHLLLAVPPILLWRTLGRRVAGSRD